MAEFDVGALDRDDPLAHCRSEFLMPEGVTYLDGNSLGPLTRAAKARLDELVSTQWGEGLIRSWNTHAWIDLPRRVGDKIGRLIGALPGSVIVSDSTSINLFKVLSVALAKRPDRSVILTQEGNFPTDRYMAEGLAQMTGGHSVRAISLDQLPDALDRNVAVLMLTEVDFRTGARLDMASLTSAAHAAGALVVWDLAHSAGAMPVDLGAANADFAIGCGYKYLNGGPGAPSFVYVAPEHLDGLHQPLTGWMGHATPFAFSDDYVPAPSIEAMLVGTPPILSLAALDAALEVFDGIDMQAVKAKADRLFDLFASLVGERCPDLELVSPRDPARRGTQIAFRHPEAYAVMQALIEQGVIGDFRGPDLMRFGLTPLYLNHADIVRAVQVLAQVLADRSWDQPRFRQKARVV